MRGASVQNVNSDAVGISLYTDVTHRVTQWVQVVL